MYGNVLKGLLGEATDAVATGAQKQMGRNASRSVLGDMSLPPVQQAAPKSKLVELAELYGSPDAFSDDLRGTASMFHKETGLRGGDILKELRKEFPGVNPHQAVRDIYANNTITPRQQVQQVEDITSRIKPLKLDRDTLYHGTSNEAADSILKSGYLTGDMLPESAYRGGGYGEVQRSTSFATNPKAASRFATALNSEGSILQAKLKPNSKVVSVDGIEYAEDLNDMIPQLREQGVDAVYIGGGEDELVSINPAAIQNTGSTSRIRATDIRNTDFDSLFPEAVEEPLRSYSGDQIADEVIELGSDQGGINDYLANMIRRESYQPAKVKISDLRRSDPTLDEYLTNMAGEIREYDGVPFAMDPVISSKGEVHDGYNRIAQKLADGEEYIDVLRGIQ